VDITSVYNSGWRDLDATLPVAAEDQSVVYLKWIADDTSTRLGSSDQNDGTALTHIYVYADDVVVVDEDAPQLLSTVPAQNATTASASGSITLTFDERVQAGSGNSTLGSVVLSPSFGSKTATFSYSGLTYNTDYTFTVPSGAIQDLSGNPFAGITLNFRTMNRPTPAAKTFDYIVAADGSGNGLTIQSAFDAVPTNNATPFLIFVKNGTYNEYPSLPSNKAKVSLIGQSRDGVIISGSRYSGLVDNGVTYSTSTCQTLEILASDFYGENFTVRNTAGVNAGQAVALKSYGDKNAFKNVKLLGYQDTHLTGTGRQLYKSCDIRGTVDFIFGDGDVFFDECLLYCEGRSGGDVITAPSTGASLAWGYVFNNCTIDGDATTQNNNYYLGRPWQNAPRAVYINTTMNIMPHSAGWTKMAVSPALFAEYNSVNASLQPIDLSNRKSSYTKDESNGGGTTTGHQTVLSGVEAAEYTMENVLKGLDNWNPLLKTDVTAAPTHVRVNASGEIIWDEVSYAISYLVLKNNVVITNTSNLTYTDGSYTGTDIYSVMAVAEYGALSSSSQATTSSATDHFRSFASGNWNEADSWESSSDNSGWNVATLSPTNAAASVKIMAGHLITVSTESTSSGLSVQPGAKLSIATGQTLNITGNLLLESSSIATASFVNAGTCSVSGTSSVQQYFASGRNWYFASPVSNATSAVIKSSPGNQLWERNVSANSWTEITTSNVDFTPLKGYVGKLAESGIVTFTGNINNGNVPALTLTSYGVASGKFHLVGNPYPSYLDWQAVVAANPNVMPTLWFRTKTGTDTYTFATVLMSDGVAIPATNNANTSITKFIPPMQAFWVRINDGTASANFTVNNSMRSHADVSGNRFKAPVTSPQLLRLEVTNGTHSDEAVIYFNQNASDAFDRYDAPKMFNNNAAIPEIFTRAGNERLVINGLNGVNFGTIVPLGFQSGQANSFSIRASDLQNFDADMRIILIDRASNREFNLTYGESYEFTAEAGTTEERFSVQFKSASGTTANDDALTGKVFVSSSQGKLMLQLNTEISNASVTVFNATGQSIHSQEVNTHLTVINKTLNAGAYLVKVENGGRSVVLRTIIN
jgi:pectin methylesterase-like acyl-CoA thioesterase